ncbi:xanthine dehydrogenase family protein molybdopterin-binding subunit [Mesorhizobium sp. B2-4-8]|uniref:xanthine dehydrogenase family protein molybdopterin-binding subunit n=1 Tax=Mesorhizobium sp. B2-4-8 TaxID=2589941 RepID=UPI0011260013|nr:xanthine dehydrogenase family protein molybdopterin-binding subunit [Mesorhizobium sp. B2-4-8]TPL35531.1 xanthine dehydrogenase family protein molybdopterin-binding subunit [Mesorhizobium sp. B2-4-8]
MTTLIGEGHDRLDGPAKVTGAARYTAEFRAAHEVHAALVLSSVAAGRVHEIKAADAERIPGVVAVLTHLDAPKVSSGPYRLWLQDATVHHAGQPVALVLAETERTARQAARIVTVDYCSQPALPRLTSALAEPYVAPFVHGESAETCRGDLAAGNAQLLVEALYATPGHCHNPLEPHAVLAEWNGNQVTVHTSTSGIFAARRTIAQAMEVPVNDVRVLMRYQGGGFGSKGSAWWPTLILAVSVARRIGRPLRLELTREEMFTLVGRRAPTVQYVALGAGRSGKLTRIEHEAVQETSPLADYSDPTCFASRSVYACANVRTRHLLVRANVPQPNAMRAPGEGPGSFALESALDELAHVLQLDPVELRLKNIAPADGHRDRDWSSNGARECLVRGADAFGWQARPPASSRKQDSYWSVGQGMACAYYPVFHAPAAACVRINSEGRVSLLCGNQDIGTGSLTVMVQAVARELGVGVDEIIVAYGDTDLPETPMAAGSMGTASVVPAVERAARLLRETILRDATEHARSPFHGMSEEAVLWVSPHKIVAKGTLDSIGVQDLARLLGSSGWEGKAVTDQEGQPKTSGCAFGACFAEVRVDATLGYVSVSRLTGAFAAGRILNRKLARSQYMGGMVFGLGMALHEQIEEDAVTGFSTNRNLNGYLIPSHADVPAIDVHFVEEHDTNPATHGLKGIGMIGTVGVAAAIANAVFDATGRRIRELPIVPGKVAS